MNPIAEIFIYAAFGCALAALILLRRQANWAVWAMVLAAGSTALGAALLDPFLNVWDEQFHALVAKNFTHHWWVPTLFDTPVLSYDYRNWVGNHIWLHKQPLFLWQIAGSIKLFGTSPLAVRLPSVLMHALTSYFIYGIGTRTMNMRVGILAGLLCAFMYFPLELVVGGYATDHNDTAFLCYVTGAFWAALNYEETRQTKWLWVLGVFSGAAVLIKWLMGLIALLIWGISGLFTAPRKIWANAVPQLGAFGIAVILFLPWQVYTWMTFPEESLFEMTFNGSHFFEVIEGHGGSWNYYFTEGVSKLFGSGVLVPYLLVVGWCMLGLRARTRFQKVYLMAAVAFVYGFYSLAATKMLAFPLIVFPLLMLGLAALLDGVYTYVAQQWKRGRWMVQVVGVLAMGMILYGFLNIPELTRRHSAASSWWRMKVEEDMRIREAVAQLPPGAILFGAKTHDNDHIYSYIIFMFYGDGLTAVANMPDAHQLSQLRAQDISGYYVYRDQQIHFESIE